MNLHAIKTNEHDVLLAFMQAMFPYYGFHVHDDHLDYRTIPNDPVAHLRDTNYWGQRANRWDQAGRQNVHRY